MPLEGADDLREIANQAIGDLDAVRDFYEHSNIVWLSFQEFVRAGHTIASTSSNTGTTIDQLGLVRLTTRYMGDHLAGFIFRQSVTIFESFFFAFFHRILQHNPWQFSRSQLDFETVLRAKDRDEVVANVLLKQVHEVRFGSPRDWFKALDGAVKLGCPTIDEIDTIARSRRLGICWNTMPVS